MIDELQIHEQIRSGIGFNVCIGKYRRALQISIADYHILPPGAINADAAVADAEPDLEKDYHRIFLNDRSPLGPLNSTGRLPERTCFARACTAAHSLVVVWPETQLSTA